MFIAMLDYKPPRIEVTTCENKVAGENETTRRVI
jgi:hypothetical protein